MKGMLPKVLVILVLLVTVPMVLIGFLLIPASQQALKESILRDRREIAIGLAERIDHMVTHPLTILDEAARLMGTLQLSPKMQQTALIGFKIGYPIFKHIHYVDKNGMELSTTDLGRELIDRSADVAYKVAIRDTGYVSPIYIVEKTPLSTFAVPVKRHGRVEGALIAEVNLFRMWALAVFSRFGETGRVYVVSRSGCVIAHSDPGRALAKQDVSDLSPVKAVLAGNIGSDEHVIAEGEKWLCAYAPVNYTRWGVVVEQTEREAYKAITKMKNQSWMLILASLIVALIVGFLATRRIVRPISRLVRGARRFARGDLDHRIEVPLKDELGQLADSFNQMADELRDKIRELERVNEELEDYIYTVSHDLKAPIISLQGFSSILKQEYESSLGKKGGHYLERIQGNIRQMDQLTQDLLELSRISRTLNPSESVEVSELIGRATAELRQQLDEKGVKLVVQPELPRIRCDRIMIGQVFFNLISNAIKFMGDTPHPRIEIGYIDRDTYNEFWVKDNGIGIEKEHHEKIFRIFHRLRDVTAEGTGIGLTVARRIIRNHGGRIWVESEKDRGASFHFTIPK